MTFHKMQSMLHFENIIKKGHTMRKNILILLSTICLSLFAQKENGAVCFTFDDYAGKNWLAADAIFKKYNAHATFFISGGISQEKAAVMKKLQDAAFEKTLRKALEKEGFLDGE